MGHALLVWKILEDLLLELRKKTVQIPVNVLEDLRAARSMIELSYSKEDISKEAVAKAEVYITNAEAYLINQAQKVFEPNEVTEWLNRLKEANLQKVTKEVGVSEDRFVIGVPRGQQWIRIETDSKLSEEYVFKLAKEWHCTVNKQTNGRLMVYGQQSDVKAFVKQVATEFA